MLNLKLKLDPIMVDTKLAEEYFKANSEEFHSLGTKINENKQNYTKDTCGNKIFTTEPDTIYHTPYPMEFDRNEVSKKLAKLAENIELNAELFSQLDYLSRQVVKRETLERDIALILQNVKYMSTAECLTFWPLDCNLVCMYEDSELAKLGLVAQILARYNNCKIYSTKSCAAVCHLFTNLCHEAGFDKSSVSLVLINEDFNLQSGLDWDQAMFGVGVVTESCDMASAVDSFLTSTTRKPWKLKHVFVQESVYEKFQVFINGKYDLRHSENEKTLSTKSYYEDKCLKALNFEVKYFLFDYTGVGEELQYSEDQLIYVEAYRTTKELLNLLKNLSPYCMSLWSSDVAQSNEIAYGVTCSVIWLNEIDTFVGPNKSSMSYYGNFAVKDYIDKKLLKAVLKLRSAWLNRSVSDRKNVLKNIINGLRSQNENVEFFEGFQERINRDLESFAQVSDGLMCIGRDTPQDLYVVSCSNSQYLNNLPAYDFGYLLGNVLFGSAIICPISGNTYKNMFKAFAENGVPAIGNLCCVLFEPHYYPIMIYKTKVVYTNYGTTFAN